MSSPRQPLHLQEFETFDTAYALSEILDKAGVVVPFNFGRVNVFVNTGNILDSSKDLVYLTLYTLGKKRLVMWGYYSKSSKTFKFEGECKLQTSFMDLHKSIADRKMEFGYTVMEYQATKKVYYYLYQEEYIKAKLILSYYSSEITFEDIELAYPGEVNRLEAELEDSVDMFEGSSYQELLNDYLLECRKLIKEYETKVNKIYNTSPWNASYRLYPTFASIIKDTVNEIEESFYDHVKTGKLWSDAHYTQVEPCPRITECSKHDRGLCGAYNYGGPEYVDEDDEDELL